MAAVQQRKKSIPVLAHPDIFAPKLKARPTLEYIGPPFSRVQAEAAGAVMLECRGPVPLAPGLTTTGEVPRRESLETVEGFWTVRDGHYCPDAIPDDQALAAVLPDRGLAVITGCAHSGIINTINYCLKLAGCDHVRGWIGGTHLGPVSAGQRSESIKALENYQLEFLATGHCTGFNMMAELQRHFGEKFIHCYVSQVIDID